MKYKIDELKKGHKIEVFDKSLISHIQEELGMIVFARQCESHFEVWIPSNQQWQTGNKDWCKANYLNAKEHKNLLKYIREVTVVWKD